MRLGGGVATIRQYLRAGLVDEMHLAIAPVLLGCGRAPASPASTCLRSAIACTEHVAYAGATHVVLKK